MGDLGVASLGLGARLGANPSVVDFEELGISIKTLYVCRLGGAEGGVILLLGDGGVCVGGDGVVLCVFVGRLHC